MAAFAERLRRKGVGLCTQAEVKVVRRDAGGVALQHRGPDGQTQEHALGTLVLAIQPHHALTALGTAVQPEERAVLGDFTHTVDVVRVHREAPQFGPMDSQKLWNIELPAHDAPRPEAQATLPMVIKKTCAGTG